MVLLVTGHSEITFFSDCAYLHLIVEKSLLESFKATAKSPDDFHEFLRVRLDVVYNFSVLFTRSRNQFELADNLLDEPAKLRSELVVLARDSLSYFLHESLFPGSLVILVGAAGPSQV